MPRRLILTLTVYLLALWMGQSACSQSTAEQEHCPFRIGLLSDTSYFSEHATAAQWDAAEQLAGFRQGMKDLGIVEGKDWVLIVRTANRDHGLLNKYAAELVAMKVDAIAASSTTAATAVTKLTKTIPIIAWGSLGGAVPAGQATNVTGFTQPGVTEYVSQLKMLVPRLKRLAVLYDTSYAVAPPMLADLKRFASTEDIELIPIEIGDNDDFATAFGKMVQEHAQAVLLLNHPRFLREAGKLASLALEHRLPMASPYRQIADAGGLIAHHPDWEKIWRRGAKVLKQILDGTPPGQIAVQTGDMRYYVNLKTADLLGIVIPESLRNKVQLIEADAANATDESEIRRLFSDYEAAWNRHDAAALAAFYTEDGDAVFPSGRKASGREAVRTVEAANQATTNRNSHTARQIQSIRFLTPQVALVDETATIDGMTNDNGETVPSRNALMTTVLVKRDGTWRIAANRAMLPAVNSQDASAQQAAKTAIRDVEEALVQAILHSDAASLERLLADDCLVIAPSGSSVRNKGEEIRFAGSGILHFENWLSREMTIRIYGTTAVVNRLDELILRSATEDRSGLYRYTNVWVNRDGRWQIVSHQPAGPFKLNEQQIKR